MSKRSLAIAAAGSGRFEFNNVSLLLSGDGTNGAQNNTFIDSSTSAFGITRTGNVTQGSFSPFKSTGAYSTSANGGSGYFDGVGDYLTAPADTRLDLTGDFTIEYWFYAFDERSLGNEVGNGTQIGSGCWYLRANTVTKTIDFAMAISTWAGVVLSSNSGIFNLKEWVHVAATRSGNTYRLFVNGTQVSSTTNAGSLINTGRVTKIGWYTEGSGTYSAYWYLSSLRIVKGTAVYTSAFTPSTAPLTAITNTVLLLNFTNAGIYDSAMKHNLETFGNAQISTGQKKFGTGSMYFDGTGDYLKIQNSSTEFGMGTGDFTAEAWVYLQGTGLYYPNVFNIATADNNANNRLGISFGDMGYGYKLFFGVGGTTYTIDAYNQSSFNNVWRHVAVSRSNGIVRCFVDGVLVNTATNTADMGSSAYFYVGNFFNEYGSSYYWKGYIDDIRITKGFALYTANFTPPSQALPNS